MNSQFSQDEAKNIQSPSNFINNNQPRLEMAKNGDSSRSSGKSPEQQPCVQNQAQNSPERLMAMKNSREVDALSPHLPPSNSRRAKEDIPERSCSSPSRMVLFQAPSFGCLAQKQSSSNNRSPLRSPPQQILPDNFNGQNNIFFNRNIAERSNQNSQNPMLNSLQAVSQREEGKNNNIPALEQNSINRVVHSQGDKIEKQRLLEKANFDLVFGSLRPNQSDNNQEESKNQPNVFSDNSSYHSLGQQAQHLAQRNLQQQSFIPNQNSGQHSDAQVLQIPVGTITTVNLNNFRIGQADQQIHQYNVPMPIVSYQQQPIVQNSSFLYGNGRGYIESFVQIQPSDIFNQGHPYLVVQNPSAQQQIPMLQQQINQSLQVNHNPMFSSLVAQQYSHSDQNIPQNSVGPQLSNNSSHLSNQHQDSNISNQANANIFQHQNVVSARQDEEREERKRQENILEQIFGERIVGAAIANQAPIRLNQYQIDEVQDDGRSQDSPGSELSDLSSIPSEHEEGLNHNEYIRRYALKIVTITWTRDSHGLFDFEMRQLARENFVVNEEQNFVRIRECCKLLKPEANIRSEFQKRAQLLMSIKQYRNRYMLMTPVKYMLRNAITPEEIKQIQERDVESFYNEIGEQLLQPYDMCERMYLVVRSIINDQNVHQDYELKKGDIIKVGRAKFLVRDINIKNKNKKQKQKNQKILRLRKGYAEMIAQKRRSASANQDQPLNQSVRGNSRVVSRQPLHREPLVAVDNRVRNRTAVETQIDTMNNGAQEGLIRQRDPSVGGATQFTETIEQEERKEQSDIIDYPQNLELVKSDDSSNESDEIKNYRGKVLPEQDKHFKKMVKKYADLQMAPLEEIPPVIVEQQVQPQRVVPVLSKEKQNRGIDTQHSQSRELKLQELGRCDNDQNPPLQVKLEQADAVGLDSSSAYCRFCWANEHDNQNPLISSCSCSGGVRFVHFECLKTWIRTKMVSQETQKLKMFYWKTFECEICKSVFPSRFKTQNGLKYSLFDFQLDKMKDYLMLESINIDKSPSKLIYLLVPSGQGNQFKMGRANDQDVRINDISVSRQHATIHFADDKFKIKDNLSKFGTLIQIQNQIEIKPNQTRILQVGRTIMNVSLRPVKRKEPHNSQILWQDNNKQGVAHKMNGSSQINDQKSSQDNKKNVKDLCNRIKNTDNYIKQQSDLHRRMIDNIHVENVGYSIERRQLNMNLDDFYKNLAKDESSESESEFPIMHNRRRLIEEESKGQPGGSRANQLEERKVGSISAERQNPNVTQPQRRAPPQQRVVPNGRIFIENAEPVVVQRPFAVSNNRVLAPPGYVYRSQQR